MEQREHKKPVMSDLRECVTGDTLVCLADGRRVPIRDLVGQTPSVLSMRADGRIVRSKSDLVWCVGTKPIYEMSLASGRRIRTTANHRLYCSYGWQKVDDLRPGDRLAVGSIRYGIMCRADGMVFDDGVVIRLAADRFLTSTTTGNAAEVLEWMEEWLQTEWPDLRVRLTSVTDHWSTVAIVGPCARDVLCALAPQMDFDNAAFPFMTLRQGTVAGTPARVCRVSFSGELAFEVNVPGPHALAVWQAVMAAGEPFGITPYGTETMHVVANAS